MTIWMKRELNFLHPFLFKTQSCNLNPTYYVNGQPSLPLHEASSIRSDFR